jgi:hypothetical protein
MAASILLAVAGGCEYAPTSYAAAAMQPPTDAATDPVGDTFGAGLKQWDVTMLSVAQLPETTVVVLELTSDVVTALSGDSTALLGYIDFDVDQDSTTGRQTAVDEYRHDGGSTGMRSEFTIVLGNVAPDSSMRIADPNSLQVGRTTPRIEGKRLTFRIPNAQLGSAPGRISVSAIVGAIGGVSDFVPNSGHLATHF